MTKSPRVLYGCIAVVDIILLVFTELRGGKIKRLAYIVIPFWGGGKVREGKAVE